ncbi:MAG: sensor histidine kinase [Gaiellaceae bacterium]
MRSLWPLARRYGFDALIVVAAIQGTLTVAFNREATDAPRTTLWFCVPAVALVMLPLLARRRFPFAAPFFVWLLGPAISFVDGRLVPFTPSISVAGLAAAFLLGNLRNNLEAWLGLGVVLSGAAIVVYHDPSHSAPEFFFVPLLFSIGWLAGYALQERAEQAEAAEQRASLAEREREAAARIAVAEERARIARELHDIVAHAVSVMVLQIGAVRHKLPDELGEDREALQGVEQAGRTALAEMRQLLSAMRRDGDSPELVPQPGLEHVESLLGEVRRAGLPVELHVEGEPPPVPRAVDLSAYRIVQEGLTNALKHAHATRADVNVRYRADALELEVRDNGVGAGESDGLGHGLVGMRERVKIYGGEMTAGTANGRGFVLNARLPLVRR